MGDKRHKNARWIIETDRDGCVSWDQIQCALLMDIRDELQALNRIFGCENFLGLPRRVQLIESAVNRIDKRMAKRIKLK